MLDMLKGFLFFAVLVAIALSGSTAFNKSGGFSVYGYGQPWALYVLAAVLAAWIIIWARAVRDRASEIEGWLKLAERDLNGQLSSGMEHGGRKGKVAERAQWSAMAASPGRQTFEAGYRTPAHDLIDLNEKDLAAKGAAMGRAAYTASLFRELYEGSVESAQRRIEADVKNSGNIPYVAPGIRDLIGFDLFDREAGFPIGAGVIDGELKHVAKHLGFPSRDLRMVSTSATGERTALRGNDVLLALTQQRAPPD
jgi:hypothetical protein